MAENGNKTMSERQDDLIEDILEILDIEERPDPRQYGALQAAIAHFMLDLAEEKN